MAWVRFEPTIPAFKQAKTVHALDRATTVIGKYRIRSWLKLYRLTESVYYNMISYNTQMLQKQSYIGLFMQTSNPLSNTPTQ
jgi:hypothetical protein